jgi:hypothetical protein
MNERSAGVFRLGEAIGISMWIAWAMFLGPGGFLLMLGVAYAMFAQNLALGIACCFLLFLPILLTLLWFPIGLFAALCAGLCERRESRWKWRGACAQFCR